MSLILTWDNPQETYTPVIRRVVIWRGPTDPFQGKIICQDSSWGIFEDVEGIDPLQQYAAEYRTVQENAIVIVQDWDIRRYLKPDDVCKIKFTLKDPDGAPSVARNIEISNETEGTNFYRRVVTNHSGYAEFFGTWGQRLLLRIDGKMKALDFVVPEVKEIDWDGLREWGSWIDTDQRGYV